MLVLSRKKNESIVFNDDITVVVVEIRGDKVRLGVEHPPGVSVHRNEVYEAIRRNQKASGAVDSPLSDEAIRRRIVDLQSQIRELESKLTAEQQSS
jgi:carbon storage regulator